MKKKGRRIEVRTPKGELILSLVVHDEEVFTETNEAHGQAAKTEPKKGKGNGSNGRDETAMTEPQQKYLFRLLSDQGIEGDSAHEYLKKYFRVNSLKDVTKQEASKAIEELLADAAKGGEAHAGSPV